MRSLDRRALRLRMSRGCRCGRVVLAFDRDDFRAGWLLMTVAFDHGVMCGMTMIMCNMAFFLFPFLRCDILVFDGGTHYDGLPG